MKANEDGAVTSAFLYKQALATALSCLIPACTGLTFGITAVMLPQLREDQSISYNPAHESWIASISILSLIIGSLSSGQILDSFGRKAAHIILGIPFIIGWIVISCANSTSIIILGRFITGLSSGANKVVTMVYIAEITEPKVRAIALLMPSLMLLLGVLFSHVVGYYLYWKTSSILCIWPALISVIAFVFLKESPFWLIAKGRTDKGVENYRWFRGTSDSSEAELKIVLETHSEKSKISVRETFNAVWTRAFIKPMLILFLVVLNIQLTGINVITFYSLDIFKKIFKGNVDPFIMTIAMDCIRTIVTLGICIFGKSIPRKIALIMSNFCNAFSVIGLSACFLMNYDVIWVSVLCLIMYIGFASAFIALGWTFVPELLPSTARGFGSGLNSAVSFLLLFGIVKTAPEITKSFGEAAMFGSFGTSSLICGLILCFALPETNGKTLQSIEDGYKIKKVEENTQFTHL